MSPGLFEVLELLGRERRVDRLDDAVKLPPQVIHGPYTCQLPESPHLVRGVGLSKHLPTRATSVRRPVPSVRDPRHRGTKVPAYRAIASQIVLTRSSAVTLTAINGFQSDRLCRRGTSVALVGSRVRRPRDAEPGLTRGREEGQRGQGRSRICVDGSRQAARDCKQGRKGCASERHRARVDERRSPRRRSQRRHRQPSAASRADGAGSPTTRRSLRGRIEQPRRVRRRTSEYRREGTAPASATRGASGRRVRCRAASSFLCALRRSSLRPYVIDSLTVRSSPLGCCMIGSS